MLSENKLFKRGIKYFTYVVLFLLIINVSFFLYLVSFRIIAFDKDIYKSEFQKYNIYDKFPGTDIDRINSDLLDYFMHEEKDVPIGTDFFNDKEKAHLIDVKFLMRVVLFSFYSGFLAILVKLILLILLVKYQKEDLFNYAAFMAAVSGALAIIPTLAAGIIMKIGFGRFFTIFHQLAFDNNLWMLDPATDNLIVMYPQGFFYDMAMKIVWATMIQAVILLVGGIAAYKIRKRFKNKRDIARLSNSKLHK